jgi:hypothetical protein
MFDYSKLKQLARAAGRPVTDLLALSPVNDPFYAGVSRRGVAAEWFAETWQDHAAATSHLRRLHYVLVSSTAAILLPNGKRYQNTEADWNYLCWASLAARYLDLIQFDRLVDRRNAEPMIYAEDMNPDRVIDVTCSVTDRFTHFDMPEFPALPSFAVEGFDVVQNYIVEVWIEKSTQNDWLEPLCRRRGVNLVVGIGEQSEIRSRELAQRAALYHAPVRVLYLSDFDPAGRSKPKAVARKVEFAIAKFGLDIDFQLIPVGLTLEQCQHYRLPRTPIKETERRRDKFEQTFGRGATELDALEALYPGEMARILEAEIDNWLDRGLAARVRRAESEQEVRLRRIAKAVQGRRDDEVSDLMERFEAIINDLQDWEFDADRVWGDMVSELESQAAGPVRCRGATVTSAGHH